MKLYLAGSTLDAEIVNELAYILTEDEGHEIISTWHEPHAFADLPPQQIWDLCFNQISVCDAIIVCPTQTFRGLRGALVEAGYAIGLQKKVILLHVDKFSGDWKFSRQVIGVASAEELLKVLGA